MAGRDPPDEARLAVAKAPRTDDDGLVESVGVEPEEGTDPTDEETDAVLRGDIDGLAESVEDALVVVVSEVVDVCEICERA